MVSEQEIRIFHRLYVARVSEKFQKKPKSYAQVELQDSLKEPILNIWVFDISYEQYRQFKQREGKRIWVEILDKSHVQIIEVCCDCDNLILDKTKEFHVENSAYKKDTGYEIILCFQCARKKGYDK